MNEQMFSQLYEVNVPALAIDEVFSINLEKIPYSKYIPFNFVMVTNNSDQKIRLIVNDSVRKLIPPGTIQTFDSSTIPAIWSLRIQNKGILATNADEITIDFQKVKGVIARATKLLGWNI